MTARQWIAVVGVVLVAAALGFSAGRFLGPEKVETRIEYRDLTVDELLKGVTFTKTVNRIVYRDVVTTVVAYPDGGTATTTADRSIEHEGSDTARTEDLASRRSTTSEGSSSRTVTLRPDWRVTGQVGASLVDPKLSIAGPLVIGLGVEKRILGGVSAGVWANSVGAAGVSVSGEF